jgi:hypothetical protein
MQVWEVVALPRCGPVEAVTSQVISAPSNPEMGGPKQQPAGQGAPNLPRSEHPATRGVLVSGPVIRLPGQHGNVRRDGYRNDRL